MAKLQDMFTHARRAQSGGGIGFLGKGKAGNKAHTAALVVEFPTVVAGGAEAALKAGADGLLFLWDGKNSAALETIKTEIESARAGNEQLIAGLHITSGFDAINRESLAHIKEQGIQYIILPFNAPARLLALENKEVEKVVTIPLREGEMYPLFIRNIAALDGIAAVLLDFGSIDDLGSLTIEETLNYLSVREAARFPAFFYITGALSEADAYTLRTMGIQAVILAASASEDKTRQEIKAVREALEKVHQEDRDNQTPSLPRTK